MDDFIWTCLAFGLVWWAGYKTGQNISALRITRLLIENDPDLARSIEQARRTVREAGQTQGDQEDIKVEQVNGVIYVYTKDTDEFLAQAHSLEQALEQAAQRFPSRKFRREPLDNRAK
jgi:hypothetical protein